MARKVASTGSHGATQLQRGLLDGRLGDARTRGRTARRQARAMHAQEEGQEEGQRERERQRGTRRRRMQQKKQAIFFIARTDELTIRLATDVNYHW